MGWKIVKRAQSGGRQFSIGTLSIITLSSCSNKGILVAFGLHLQTAFLMPFGGNTLIKSRTSDVMFHSELRVLIFK